MAITVKHTKVSTVPDAGDTSLVQPSDWNADHTLTGTVPVANGGTGAATLTGYVKGNGTSAMTAATTIPNTDITGLGTASTKDAGVANGVATLDSGGKVPVSQIPALGDLNYQGTWNASTNSPTLTSSVGTKGYYYVVNVAGSTNLDGITDWQVGDWAVFNGTVWQKIDNTDAVTSVNGQTGTVVITLAGLGGGTIATQNANNVAITGGAIDGTTIGATTPSTVVGTTITGNTAVKSPYFDATTSAGGALRNASGTNQIQWGSGGGNNVSIDVSANLNGSNAQIDISPTGTGHVHINPTGSGSVQINPTSAGTIDNIAIGGTTKAAGSFTTLSSNANTSFSGANCSISIQPTGTGVVYVNPATTGAIDNMTIGATTPKAITGTTITATTFNGSGSGLTNVVNSLAASTGISVSGSTGAVTVTNTAPDQTVTMTSGAGISVTGTYPNFTVTNTSPSSGGTVTSVSGTAPIVSSGGNTPAISIPAATGSVNGYLTSTDWTTFNNKQPAGSYLTTVTADAPLTGSGTSGSHLSIPAASGSVNGYLSSTDWTTFNNKGSGTVTSVSVVSANGFAGTSSGGATPALTLTTSISGVLKGSSSALAAATAGTDFVAPATATNFTAQQYFGNVALTDGATISWAANTAQVATFTFVSSNRTMGAPSGLVSGAYYGLAVIQNSGSNTLTWNSVFKWAGGSAPTLSTAAGAKDYFVFRSDGTNLYEQGRSLGVA